MQKTAVLIIGAGPTGLMMACQLSLLNIPFIIVEKDPKSTTESRAIGIQARSLEIFAQMGIADTFVHQGNPAENIDFVDNGKLVQEIPLKGLGVGLTQFPFLLLLEQSKTEKNLLDFLKSHRKEVLYDTIVESFVQDDEKTTAILQTKDGKRETVQALWIVGADGAHSIVRHTLGIELAGKTYKESLFVLDCNIHSSTLSKTHLSVVVSNNSFAAIFPMPNNHWRIVGEISPQLYGKDEITFEQVNKDFGKRLNIDITLSNPYWISLYHAHHRCVSTFKKGRCFLVGDAAHIHSPVGAQGMNTGLQDSYNLAWKLAFVYKKWAKREILETFNEERLPFAKRLVATTDRIFSLVVTTNKIGALFRGQIAPRLIRLILRLRFARNFIFQAVSQIGIAYRTSSLSQHASFGNFPKNASRPGDRLPYILYGDKNIQDEVKITHVQLLLLTGENEHMNSVQHIVGKYTSIKTTIIPFSKETKVLYQKFGITKTGYYLVRPDMYIACRSSGENTQALENYLSRFFIKA